MALWNIKRKMSENREQPDSLEVEVPQEIEAQLQAGKEAQEKLAVIEAEHAKDQELITKMRGDLDALNSKVNPPPAAPAPPDPITDPDAYFNYRVAPLVNVTLQNTARQELDLFSRSVKDWSFFGTETRDMIRKGTLQQQSDPVFIENCYLIVKGRHSQEIAEGKFTVTESPTGTSGVKKSTTDGGRELTQEQIDFGKRYGIKPEDLKKVNDRLKFVS